MQYTEKDLKEGTKLRCTHSKPAHWTVGKVYELSSDNIGELSITDNDGSPAFKNYMLDCLNGNHNPVSFEIVEEEKEMKYTEKDLYKCMKLRCIDDGLYDFWKEGAIYTVEENPYGGLIIKGEGDRSDRPTCDILNYLNGETLVKMEIVEDEKEEPTLKANVNVDTLEVIEAKIEQLANEETNLYNKRMRIKEQEESLREKRMKLKEAKKALEFLKQQKFL